MSRSDILSGNAANNRADPDTSVPLSALQHWLFCPRQYALIHVERVWAENRHTAEGRVLHERVDAGVAESRDGIRILRAVQVASEAHGMHGVADIVEMRKAGPYPVEYKRGRPKAHRADEVQLCAQAICLEEMTGLSIPEAALFYGIARRRTVVRINATLRALTLQVADHVRDAMQSGPIPPPINDGKKCNDCSMRDLCRPTGPRQIGGRWLIDHITRAGVPD